METRCGFAGQADIHSRSRPKSRKCMDAGLGKILLAVKLNSCTNQHSGQKKKKIAERSHEFHSPNSAFVDRLTVPGRDKQRIFRYPLLFSFVGWCSLKLLLTAMLQVSAGLWCLSLPGKFEFSIFSLAVETTKMPC
jgi:hypothetical protein